MSGWAETEREAMANPDVAIAGALRASHRSASAYPRLGEMSEVARGHEKGGSLATTTRDMTNVTAALSAYQEAIIELRRLHFAEYEKLLGDARAAHGLPRVPFKGDSPASLRQKIARHEDLISRWEIKLAAFNGAAHV